MGFILFLLLLFFIWEIMWFLFFVGFVVGFCVVFVFLFGIGFGCFGGLRFREEIVVGFFGVFGGFIICFFFWICLLGLCVFG